MALAFFRYAPYGTQTTFYFTLEDGADATELYTGTDFVAGDVKISKDGGALANTSNAPAQITGSQPGYSITLTATEMQATNILVTMRDASASAWRGVCLNIVTQEAYSKFTLDATPIGGNADAFRCTGVGTGTGITGVGGGSGTGIVGSGGASSGTGIVAFAAAGNSVGFSASGFGTGQGIKSVGGATGDGVLFQGGGTSGNAVTLTPVGSGKVTINESSNGVLGNARINLATAGSASTVTLDAGASAIDDFYNELNILIIGGTGVGQSRTVSDYVGATKVLTVSRNWSTNPDATSVFVIHRGADVWDQLEGTQPSGAPAANSTLRAILQYLKRRFFNKVTQTSVLQTVLQDNGSSTLTTMACSDDGTTETKGAAS